jgi:hypothetical protein
MPFADDYTDAVFPSLENVKSRSGKAIEKHINIPTSDQQDAMDAFVSSMDLTNARCVSVHHSKALDRISRRLLPSYRSLILLFFPRSQLQFYPSPTARIPKPPPSSHGTFQKTPTSLGSTE